MDFSSGLYVLDTVEVGTGEDWEGRDIAKVLYNVSLLPMEDCISKRQCNSSPLFGSYMDGSLIWLLVVGSEC
jgi:hypothetical protein